MPELLATVSLPEATEVLGIILDFAIKGAMLLALAGLLTALLRRASAALRHLIWTLAMGSLLLLPVLAMLLPSWRVLPSWPPAVHAPWGPVSSSPVAPVTPVAPVAPVKPVVPADTEAPSAPRAPAAPVESAPPTASPSNSRSALPAEGLIWDAFVALFDRAKMAHWTVWAVLAWAGGALAVLLHGLLGFVGVWWLRRRARPVTDAAWHDLADEVGDRLFVTRHVRLLRSAQTTMPMTWGWRRPVVLLPAEADRWAEDRRRVVLTHEFAHIKRWDCLTQTLACLGCALAWVNPLVWVAARQMRIEREKACDDYVIACGTRPSTYASHLIEIARATRMTFVVPLNAVPMARPSQLEGRVLAILDPKRRRRALGRYATAGALVVTAGILLPLAAAGPSDGAKQGEPAIAESASPSRPVARPMPAAQRSRMPGASGVFTWSGVVRQGQTVEVRSLQGDIEAEPSSSRYVEIVATYDGEGIAQVVEHRNGLTVCAPLETGSCDAAAEALPFAEATVDFLVRLPDGVHLEARTREGDIRAHVREGRVIAETVNGDISLDTGDYAQARTVQGDIHARFGAAAWDGTLDLRTTAGDMYLTLPAEADLQVLAETSDGDIYSDFALARERHGAGVQHRGTVGRGGRTLALRTGNGDIYVGGDRQAARSVKESQRDAEATDALRYTLDRTAESVRLKIVEALADDADTESVAMLAEIQRQDGSERVRLQAVRALSDIGSDEAAQALLGALGDTSVEVRKEAVEALNDNGAPMAVAGLAQHLNHEPDAGLRARLIEVLSDQSDPSAVPALRRALRDADRTVRRRAAEALDDLGEAASHASVWSGSSSVYAAADVAGSSDVEVFFRDEADGAVRDASSFRFRVGDVDFEIETNLLEKLSEALQDGEFSWEFDWGNFSFEFDEEALDHLRREIDRLDARFVRDMQALDLDLDDEELRTAYLLGIDAAYVTAIRQAGYRPVLSELMELRVAGVDAAYLRDLRSAGYQGLDMKQVVALRLHGVDRAYLREMTSAGLRDLCPDKLLALRQVGVDAAYVRAFRRAGYHDLEPDALLQLRMHGIDPQVLQQHTAQGDDPIPIETLVQSKRLHRAGRSTVRLSRSGQP